MKVALLSDCYPPRTGGIESQVGDLAAQLRLAGHDVEVFTATSGAKGERAGAVEELDGVRVHRMSLRLPGGVPVNPFAPPEVARRLARGGFDVAHVHLGVVSPFAWDMARVTTSMGLPTALTWHCVLGWAAPVLAPAVRTWVQRGAVVSAVSTVAAKGVRRAAGTGVAVLPNGIDPAAWPSAGGTGPAVGSGPLRVVSAARLAPRKRVAALVRVVDRARRRLGSGAFTVEVYGDGRLRPALQAEIAARGLGHVVRLRSRASRTELAATYRQADAYLSTVRLEAFGIAALEARTAGLPVIAPAGSGVADVVTHEVSGLLAKSDDGLVEALVRLALDGDLRTRMTRHNAITPPPCTWGPVVELVLAEYRRAGA